MSSQNFDSPTYTYIMNADDGTSDDTDISTLAAKSGQFIFEETDKIEAGTVVASGTNYFFAFKDAGSVIHKSPTFDGGTVVNAVSKDTVALTEQVTYVGYNGTSGSLDAANATYYSLGIVLNHTFGLLNNSPLIKTIPFKSTAATQSNIAAGIVNAGVKAFDRQANRDVKFERINSGAASDALGTATLSVVNQGTDIVFSEDMTALVTAGTIIRIGGLGAGTTPCYIVSSVDAGVGAARVYTLDQKFQGSTDTAVAANLVESVTEGDWGIKMTGVSITDAKFNPITDTPYVVDFEVELNDNFSTAEVTYSTQPDIGFGTYQLVSYDEALGLFNDKDKQVNAYPPQPNHTFEAVVGEAYNLIEFEASDSKFSSATTGLNPISKFRIRLWLQDDTECDTDYGTHKTVIGSTAIS